jgi:sarcosine oxidase subunit gamma
MPSSTTRKEHGVTADPRDVALDALVVVRGAPQPGFPAEPNTTAVAGGRRVLWLGPDEWLVLGGREADFPGAAAAVDVSAGYVCLELEGDGAGDLLAQGCSLDLTALPVGACAQTQLARADVIVLRPDAERGQNHVRPSFAPYVRAWLTSRRSSR